MQKHFQGKTCAVLGLARSGIPAAQFLAARGARVLGFDNKPLEELSPDVLSLEELGIKLIVGEHNFEGIEKSSLIVLSPGLKIHHEPLRSVLRRCRDSGAEIIGEMELAARFCPSPIVAVTGTKGKSTTVKLITEMLQSCEESALSCGNTGSPLISALPKLTPASWVVLEVSSFQLEAATTLKPRVAVLLNLLEDHQDYHPTLEQYWETKMRLFAHQDKTDFAILNSDEKRVLEYAKQLPTDAKVLLASANDCTECAVEVQDGIMGWRIKSAFIPVIPTNQIPLAGAHNQANVASALAALFAALGEKVLLEIDAITQAIKKFSSLPHRLEVVASHGVTWINDSQATIPDASIAAIKAFAAPRILIAGGRTKLESAAYKNWAREVVSQAEYLITIGEAQKMMVDLAEEAGMPSEKIIAVSDLSTAVKRAAKLAMPGTTIIFSPACTSFDQFKSYEDRGNQFRKLAIAQSS
ncbi:MAG: UDP-N-acetylmuramoyl-L-alanine--D-glutamate ligase [Abditibacteriaceae bacterium]